MKDFNRTDLSFSLCGLNCKLCPMHVGRYCPGCGGGEGNQSCAIAKCSMQHNNIEYCFLCSEFPCRKYECAEQYDSFITHQLQLKHIKKAQELGMEDYNREQAKKAEILHRLLRDYNDGRRKTFYCIAINLLPLEDIEAVMAKIQEDISFNKLTIKEKADNIASLFKRCADEYGIVLKLRKKPDKNK